jgi:hypothetical protein
MLSLGMAVVGREDLRFYTELKPISENFVPAALEVCGLDRDRLLREAPTPEEAMTAASDWLNGLRKEGRPVFLAGPAVWDGMYVHWYFIRFTGKNPFGLTGAGIDMRTYWMGKTGCSWRDSRKGMIKHALDLKKLAHTHNALDDAVELATIFESMQAANPPAGAEKGQDH